MGILSGLCPPLAPAGALLIKSEVQRYKSGAATAQSKATAKMDSNGIKHLAATAQSKATAGMDSKGPKLLTAHAATLVATQNSVTATATADATAKLAKHESVTATATVDATATQVPKGGGGLQKGSFKEEAAGQSRLALGLQDGAVGKGKKVSGGVREETAGFLCFPSLWRRKMIT